jgi:alpha-amylase/alpha-mannosidase (GH57 family)
MSSKPINLAVIWNMHQPYYKNLVTGEFILPWVRLHGIKDYYDMVHILKDFPSVHQTFNLVPSLIDQIQEYASEDIFKIRDKFLMLTLKPAEKLSEDDRIFILDNFFCANWENMINVYPQYRKLLAKRGRDASVNELRKIQKYFTNQEMLDLQVWFNLCWFDPIFKKNNPTLKRLIKKGKNFKEEEKIAVCQAQQEVMRMILPEYRKFYDSGQIEIIFSPYYHPILPLLCDSNEARTALPDIQLPKIRFRHPEDAQNQIEQGRGLLKEVFGRQPCGMWPSEGSVSPQLIPLFSEAGIRWIATDEEILAQSLKQTLERDHHGTLKTPELLYRPYIVEKDSSQLQIVFRDHELSDLIGFVYLRWNAHDAVNDFLKRIHAARRKLIDHEGPHLISVILDGENAWEHYKNDGRNFLLELYRRLEKDPLIRCVTVEEYLSENPATERLPTLFSGSWINHNFRIWIGHQEDNAGWDQISMARDDLLRFERENPDFDKDKLRLAWEEIYIAEGSDWFWWYGDDHSSGNDEAFDELFRNHLANVYLLLGLPVPDELYESNILQDKVTLTITPPKKLINPEISGQISNYYEWHQAGFFEPHKHGGAMHQVAGIVEKIHYGFNLENLFLRIDTSIPLSKAPDYSLKIRFLTPRQYQVNIYLEKGKHQPSYRFSRQTNEHWEEASGIIQAAIDQTLEMGIGFDQIDASAGDEVQFIVILEKNGLEIERYPSRGAISLKVPCKDFESIMWQV